MQRKDERTASETVVHGCSTKLWGPWFWTSYLSLAANINDWSLYHPYWICFFFRRSFGSTGPCPHCCASQRKYAYSSQMKMERAVFGIEHSSDAHAHSLVRWLCLLKHFVNTKLNQSIYPLDTIEFALWKQPDFSSWWQECFFNWLYCQAIMFPKRSSLSIRRSNPQLAVQHRDFVLFFTQLRHILPVDSQLGQKWNVAYRYNCPNRTTFASRDALFRWVYKQHGLCLNRQLEHTVEEMQAMFEGLRSKNCGNVQQTCS